MNLKQKWEILKQAKKGDILSITWSKDGERFIKDRFNVTDESVIVFEKLYCEVGERQFNYRGEYTKTWWTRPMTSEKFFNEFYETEQNRFCVSMTFVFVIDEKHIQVEPSDIEDVEITMTNKVLKAIDKAYDYCNLNSTDDDCIYKSINKYKALKELPSEKQDEVYEIIAKRLGFK